MDENYVRAIHIAEGLKIYMPNKEGCYELEKKLNDLGIKTRVGCACGTDIWSIYIISVPDILVGTCKEIKDNVWCDVNSDICSGKGLKPLTKDYSIASGIRMYP